MINLEYILCVDYAILVYVNFRSNSTTKIVSDKSVALLASAKNPDKITLAKGILIYYQQMSEWT